MERENSSRKPSRRKTCRYCTDRDLTINYHEPRLLSQCLTSNFKILPRRITGNCGRHQRLLTQEIKRARILALIPFTTAHN